MSLIPLFHGHKSADGQCDMSVYHFQFSLRLVSGFSGFDLMKNSIMIIVDVYAVILDETWRLQWCISVVRNHKHSSMVCSFFESLLSFTENVFHVLGSHCVCNAQARSPLHSFINNLLAQGSFIVITKAISSGTISYYLHFHVNQDPACIGNKIATFIALFLIK